MTDPAQVGATIATAMDIHEKDLISFLRTKKTLLILDNFEQVREARTLLVKLMQNAPQLRLLVTSQERLHLYGEQVIELTALPVPAFSATCPDLQQNESVQLFVLNAQRHNQSFVLNEKNSKIVANHQSLHTVFQHAWERLTPDEQLAIKQLAIYPTGFNRQTAFATPHVTLATFTQLLDKSFLSRSASDWYTIHPILHHYLMHMEDTTSSPQNSITDRETEVLEEIVARRTNQEIAQNLCISINTVKRHVANIYNKLGVNNRFDAITLVAKTQ